MSAWQCCMHGAWLVMLVGGCAAILAPRDASPEADKMQGLVVESAASGAPSSSDGHASLGFVLESTLRARRMLDGRPSMFLELGNGATVIDGDRLQVLVRTSQNAYLHVAFCSQDAKDPRYSGLKVFPEEGAIRVRAYETTIVPDRAAEIVLDRQRGQEALYLILSQSELSSSDAGLAQVIAAARQGSQSTDCGSPLRTAARGSRKERKPNGVWSGKLGARGKRPPPRGTASGTPRRMKASAEQDPVVEIQRGGDVVWNSGLEMGVEADPDGIVILRYGLTHIAAP